MKKVTKSDLKGGQAYERALEAIGVSRIYTLRVTHYWYPEGETLCKCKGSLYREPQIGKPAICQRCESKLAKLMEPALKEQVRTYWTQKVEPGVLRPDAPKPKKKVAPTYERAELPAEYLSTGTGKGEGLF